MNMPTIVVTLEVSRVSGWLNSDADCAEWKGGHRKWAECGLDKDRRGAHLKHAIHARDAARVETQRLVERGCALPNQKEGILRVGRDASRETKGRGATAAQAVCTGEVPRLKIGGRAPETWFPWF